MLQHTTRTPLTNILSYAELLRDDGELDMLARHDFADVIFGNASRLQRLLEKSELLVRMKSGNFQFRQEPVDLGQLVCTEVESARTEANQRSVHITADMGEPSWCSGDKQQLEVLLSTILNNAVRFSPTDGTVVVSIKRDGGFWHLRVADSGPGISPGLMPKLFDVLSNLDSPLHNTGDGLSLCICREIATAHNGSIHVADGSESGATIIVTLPVLSRAPAISAFEFQGSVQRIQGKSPSRDATSCV